MVIDMNVSRLATVEQIREFLKGTADVAFANPADEVALRAFVTRVVRRYRYFSLRKGQRDILFASMRRLTGYSRQHLSRLVAQYRKTHSLKPRKRANRTRFARTYGAEDVALLAKADSLHDTLSGPATKVLLMRAFETFGDARYAKLAQISVSHLYNLRASERYGRHRRVRKGTRPAQAAIGVRKAPAPPGTPRLYPYRHRAAGRSGWPARRLSHQRCRYRHPVGIGGFHRADQRSLPVACDCADLISVSFELSNCQEARFVLSSFGSRTMSCLK